MTTLATWPTPFIIFGPCFLKNCPAPCKSFCKRFLVMRSSCGVEVGRGKRERQLSAIIENVLMHLLTFYYTKSTGLSGAWNWSTQKLSCSTETHNVCTVRSHGICIHLLLWMSQRMFSNVGFMAMNPDKSGFANTHKLLSRVHCTHFQSSDGLKTCLQVVDINPQGTQKLTKGSPAKREHKPPIRVAELEDIKPEVRGEDASILSLLYYFIESKLKYCSYLLQEWFAHAQTPPVLEFILLYCFCFLQKHIVKGTLL